VDSELASPIVPEWFVERPGGVRGPYTGDKLQALAERGELGPDDLIRQGMDGRLILAAKLKGLFPREPILSDESPARPAPPTPVADEASVEAPPAEEAVLFTAKRTERLQLTQVALPQAYLDLGKAIHSTQQYGDAFPRLYAKIDQSFQRIRELKQPKPADKSVGSNGRVRLGGATARNAAAANAVFRKLADQFRLLGKAAYEKDGPASGPLHLTSAIAEQQRQLATLDTEIAAFDQPAAGRALTLRRIVVSAVCVVALALPFCWLSRQAHVSSSRESVVIQNAVFVKMIPRTVAAEALPESAKSTYKAGELRELTAVARNGVAESRMVKLRRQRSAANYAFLVKEVNDFKNGTTGCPKGWVDMYWMWKGRYRCTEGLAVKVIEVINPNEFLAEGFSAEGSGQRVILRGWSTTGFVNGQSRLLSGVGYSGGKTAAYGSVLGGFRANLIEKVPNEIVRYVVDSLLQPAPK
jgi:GYF domain 2